MKFKLDENLPIEAASLLSAAGHDVWDRGGGGRIHDERIDGSDARHALRPDHRLNGWLDRYGAAGRRPRGRGAAQAEQALGHEVRHRFDRIGWQHIRIRPGQTDAEALARLQTLLTG